ncbi:MAG: cupredoxin domain-containing protein [Armatimonadota bacterium]|nr:cupredoxin domain-containing protein [Armatimonadota bacterium]MDR7438699.1 cupredoxin domain-containing protein [Armatimonadota bacterium]MDR7563741.1 cupredoxin domain-containing protein [Armatimonadota bacterium]MDR7567319.1 cupredoxin domain-containing protein [Armatimonadota bacterium]MDR7602543.1 cupredoxin domain-containing protein [Armatimonadota bacterium]
MRRRMVALGVSGILILGSWVALQAGAAPQRIKVEAKEFTYNPSRITVKAGQPVELLMENKGVIEHDFVLEKFKVKMGLLKPGQSGKATFTPTAKGTFPFYCSVPGHKEAGMTGTLVVQ